MTKKQSAAVALARRLSNAWDENEETMGEQAAYLVACEELQIDPDEGYSLLALLSGEANQ